MSDARVQPFAPSPGIGKDALRAFAKADAKTGTGDR